jgi:ribosomal protein L7/L12
MEFQQLRDRVTRLEEEFALFKQQFAGGRASEAAPDKDARIIEQLENNNLMEAIKIRQSIHHSSMAEAKQYVRELAQRLGK